MCCRAAMLMGALLSGAMLMGCQNAPQQFSIYAPFGPAVVPTPSLTRANSTPYYTPPADPKTADPGSSPATTANSGSNSLSHYDPYRGLLVPGNYSPSPVAVRTDDSWGSRDAALASTPRERTSTEEPIRIVEGSSSAFAAQGSGRSTSGTPLSGAVRPLLSLPLPPETTPVEMATRPRTSPAPARSNPATAPVTNPPGLIAPPLMSPPAATPGTNPAEPRRLSLWDSPRDGSRVMPASHLDAAPSGPSPVQPASGSWRVRE